MKKIYSFFVAVVVATTFNAQTTMNYVFANQGFANAQVITTGSIDTNLNYSAVKNTPSTPPTYYTAAGGALRMYADSGAGDGNTYTISPLNGSTISSVTINALNSYTPPVTYSVDGGAYQAATLSGTTYTITGLTAASSVAFRNAITGATTQLRVASLDITYSGGSLAVSDFNKSKSNFVKNTFVKNEAITFGADVKDVKVYNMFGQVVKTASVKNNGTLNVAELQKGSYIVTGTVNNQPVSQKILKD